MNCYVCATESAPVVAVATCPVCGVGLCFEHRREQVRDTGAGGMAIGCAHESVAGPVAAPLDARRPAV